MEIPLRRQKSDVFNVFSISGISIDSRRSVIVLGGKCSTVF